MDRAISWPLHLVFSTILASACAYKCKSVEVSAQFKLNTFVKKTSL